MTQKVPIEVSARHIHVTEDDFKKIFGNEKLNPIKKLSQEKEFASDKEVELINKDKKLKARILGPFRKETQVEISLTDAYSLKMDKMPSIKVSGDLNNASEIIVRGPKGKINAKVIIAKRHLHLSEIEAKKLKLKNNQKIKIRINGERKIIFEEIVVRAKENYRLSLHLDTDEANAAGVSNLKKSFGEIVR